MKLGGTSYCLTMMDTRGFTQTARKLGEAAGVAAVVVPQVSNKRLPNHSSISTAEARCIVDFIKAIGFHRNAEYDQLIIYRFSLLILSQHLVFSSPKIVKLLFLSYRFYLCINFIFSSFLLFLCAVTFTN
jgi:hypothetical protein